MKRSIAAIVATAAILTCGWANAQDIALPPGAVCKVVRTTVEVDKAGRTIITTKKVCEVK